MDLLGAAKAMVVEAGRPAVPVEAVRLAALVVVVMDLEVTLLVEVPGRTLLRLGHRFGRFLG